MNIRTLSILLVLIAGLLVGCDDDDPRDVAEDCNREAAYKFNGVGICATGTFQLTATTTDIELMGENNQRVSITAPGIGEQRYTLTAGEAEYIDTDGTRYMSVEGGSLNVTDNTGTMDARFTFAAESPQGIIIQITEGVVENLPLR